METYRGDSSWPHKEGNLKFVLNNHYYYLLLLYYTGIVIDT